MAEALEVTPAELDAFADRLGEVESYLHLDEKRTRVTELEAKSVAPGFWDDADAARATMEEIARTKEDIAAVDTARGELSDARAALELAEEMGDDPDAAALREEATATAERLARVIDELELSSWFTGEFDHGDAIVTIKPGQGGLEAQDWTFMLFKMYMKYCQRRGWNGHHQRLSRSRGHRHRPRDLYRRGHGRIWHAARRGRRPPLGSH